MISLVLKECLAYLFLIMDASSLRRELGIVLGIPVGLQVLCVPGGASIHCGRLTCGPVGMHVLLVQHLHVHLNLLQPHSVLFDELLLLPLETSELLNLLILVQ